jgi:hypothetical protein
MQHPARPLDSTSSGEDRWYRISHTNQMASCVGGDTWCRERKLPEGQVSWGKLAPALRRDLATVLKTDNAGARLSDSNNSDWGRKCQE